MMTARARSDSLCRRLAFAGDSSFLFDRLGTWGPVSRFAVLGDWPMPRIPAHLARVGFDLVECLRTVSRVPDIGNVELALLDTERLVPQHPRYRSYWHDDTTHAMAGMLIGVDLFRHNGKYFVIENNHGPSIYPRRRTLYDAPIDPLVANLVSTARELGFDRVVPIAFRWHQPYADEFLRAGRELGIEVVPSTCPLNQPDASGRLVALPQPLAPKTMYVIHSGLMTPVFRYIDNKWYTSRWLHHAIEHELPANSPVALPTTRDHLFIPEEDHGTRWPNLVIKLADGERSRQVIAARFDDLAQAQSALGLRGTTGIPRRLRMGFARSLLFGRDRVIYQAFVPPELDADGHAQAIRLHLFVSPMRSTFLSAHLRISERPVPERAPRGIIGDDDAFVWNDATYRSTPPAMEEELQVVADHLGKAMQRAIVRTFETGNTD